MRSLESPNLLLEPQMAAHAEAMFEVLSDPAIYAHENEPPQSLMWLRARFSRLEARGSPDGSEQWLNWLIRLQSSALAGFVQATIYPLHRAEIAYVLHRRYWGRGLASEAVKRIVKELVDQYEVETLNAVLKATNRPSQRLLERMGFVIAPVALHEAYGVGSDELLMLRNALVS